MIYNNFHNYLVLFKKLDYGIKFFVKVLPIRNPNKMFNDIFLDNLLLMLRL